MVGTGSLALHDACIADISGTKSLQLGLQCMPPTHTFRCSASHKAASALPARPVHCCITTPEAALKQACAAGCVLKPSEAWLVPLHVIISVQAVAYCSCLVGI